MPKNKGKDPIPAHFHSIQEASDFLDTHDAADYEPYLRPVQEEIEVPQELPQAVLLDRVLIEKLKVIAQRRGISLETLVNLWLEEKILVGK